MKRIILMLVCSLLFFTSCCTELNIKNLDISESNTSSIAHKSSLTNEDIYSLIPNEFHNFEYFSFLNLDNDVAYFSTINSQNNIQYTQDIFAYNIESGNIKHIINVTDLSVKIFTVYDIEGYIYLYAEPVSNSYRGNKVYLCKNDNIVLLTDTAINGIIPYENGIAYIDFSSLAAVKNYGSLKTTIASSNNELYINQLIPNNKTSVIANDSNMDFYYCNFSNGETIKKFPLLNNKFEFLRDVLLSIELDGEHKKLSIMSYEGDILATIDDIDINSVVSNNNNMFLYWGDDYSVYECTIDNKSSSIIRSKITSNYISGKFPHLVKLNEKYLFCVTSDNNIVSYNFFEIKSAL